MPFSVDKDLIYFILKLTENEHYSTEQEISNYLQESGYGELIYYRKLKLGHRPMRREIKIKFNNKKLFEFLLKYEDYLEPTNKYDEIRM